MSEIQKQIIWWTSFKCVKHLSYICYKDHGGINKIAILVFYTTFLIEYKLFIWFSKVQILSVTAIKIFKIYINIIDTLLWNFTSSISFSIKFSKLELTKTRIIKPQTCFSQIHPDSIFFINIENCQTVLVSLFYTHQSSTWGMFCAEIVERIFTSFHIFNYLG